MKPTGLDKIFCDDNLIVLQLIADWENKKDGKPISERGLEIALQKAGFEWNHVRVYTSITQLSLMQIISIKEQEGKVYYQINQEVANWLLETAIKMVRSHNS